MGSLFKKNITIETVNVESVVIDECKVEQNDILVRLKNVEKELTIVKNQQKV